MQVRFARGEQHITAPGHLALVHHGEADLRERLVDFLRPVLEDPEQAVYLCGPPAGPRVFSAISRGARGGI